MGQSAPIKKRVKKMRKAFIILLSILCIATASAKAADTTAVQQVAGAANAVAAQKTAAAPAAKAVGSDKKSIDVKAIIFGHILDSYKWEITKIHGKEISLYLPVILHSKTSGWHVFSSRKLYVNEDGTENEEGCYEGFYPAPESSAHQGKLMEKMPDGTFVKPADFSVTKVSLGLMINSTILIVLILCTAKFYRKHQDGSGVPGKFAGFMEMFIMAIEDSVVKPCVGANYKKYSPYLLTAFFFILVNNIMALIPIFPGGANVTGNIAITFFLAICTFLAVNIFGTKHYWKDILWPDVPLWLKCPIPLMPLIELFGIFTKPIALMIRLFANMLSGHMAMLVLTCLIFIGCSIGALMGSTMTVISVAFNLFMNALELLVAFIQAYVFTLLSAVFIGIAQEGSAVKSEK
jgi:F-type H+-transporting ATPase subunit a